MHDEGAVQVAATVVGDHGAFDDYVVADGGDAFVEGVQGLQLRNGRIGRQAGVFPVYRGRVELLIDTGREQAEEEEGEEIVQLHMKKR